jgi:RNA polymerase sigma factor (sigma-70 family)
VSSQSDEQLFAVNEALDKLAAQNPEKAELVKLRYFVGMTITEAADALGMSEPAARRQWAFARAWLYHEIKTVRD